MTDQPGKRILWHSVAPWVPSGYGNQTALFASRLQAAGHDVTISVFYGLGGAALEWNGITVYPSDDQWGNTTLREFLERDKPDLTVTLMDTWVLKPDLFQGFTTGSWVPVDHAPVPVKVTKFFAGSGSKPIAMSRFGEKQLQEAGLDPLYVPHGVNTNVFRPFEGDRRELRRSMGLPEDAFIVGMVANNSGHTPPRKAFPQALSAFGAFQRKHNDALLYLHTEYTGTRSGRNSGVNLPKLCEFNDIPPSAVGFANQIEMEIGIGDDTMAALYGCFDVLLNPSYGEGFGIPIVEAQACGTPVIVTDWTAMPELCGAGWKVDGKLFYNPQHGAYFLDPDVGMILEALEEAYDKARTMRDDAREFALAYDADKVFAEHWVPTLDALTKPREVPPLPNRAQRRAAAKAKA